MAAAVQIVIRYRDESASARNATADGIRKIGDAANKAKSDLQAFGQTSGSAMQAVGSDATAAAGEYRQAAGVVTRESKTAGTAIKQIGDATDDAVDGLDKTEDGFRGAGESADRSKKQFSGFGEVVTGAFRRVGELAINAMADVAMAVWDGAKSALTAAGDYEQSMNVFQAQSGATAAEMQAVSATAKALGADLTLPATSAADAGQAMLELSKAGLSVKDSMDAAQGTLQLAAAAQADNATAAAITAGVLNTFGLAGSEAVRVADLLAAAANNSSASITDLADGTKQAGFMFAATNQQVDDLAASLAILTNVGLTGSDAGTALKNALLRLVDPTKEAAALMAELGFNAYDANGNMLPLRDIIGSLNKSLDGMTQEQRNAALSTIFLSDGMKAMIPLLDAGVSGFDDMKTKVNQAGAASTLAAAQMQGMNGAMAGLSSQVETLALEALEPLLPIITSVVQGMASWAGSLQGQVGPAVQWAIDGIAQLSTGISTAFLPALSGATAALAAYAIVQTTQALPAIMAMIPALATQVAGFMAATQAAVLAVAPYAAIAIAIGAVVYKYQELDQQIKSSTQSLLASKPWWEASGAALTNYGQQAAAARQQLEPYANTIQAIRTQIEGEIESLAKRQAAGLVSQAQFAAEMAVINQHKAALEQVTGAYNTQVSALQAQEAASMTATAKLAAMDGQQSVTRTSISLTTEELQKLGNALETIYSKGAQAVSDYVTTESDFLTKAKELRASNSTEQLAILAAAYAKEQAAQSAHLGKMLADYTANQVAMGNITEEAGNKIVAEIEERFGVMEDSSAKTFLAMAASITNFANSGSSDVGSLGGELVGLADQAVTTKQTMDALEKDYVMKAVHNFLAAKGDANALASELRGIPSSVSSTVTITTRRVTVNENTTAAGGESQGGPRAFGGPVTAGVPYMVGERGREMFVPNTNGTIVANRDLAGLGNTTYVLNYYAASGVSPEADVAAALRMHQMLMG